MSLEVFRGKKIVILWSGGLDSTALIAYLVEEYQVNVLPLFTNRCQLNYEKEKKSIKEFSKLFSEKYDTFNNVFEVKIISPPLEFKEKYQNADIKKLYVMRNSDIINQGVRYAILNGYNIIAVASNIDDTINPLFGDNSIQYLQKKTEEVREGTLNPVMEIIAPFLIIGWRKNDIIKWCTSHDIPIHKSWSCWNNKSYHCGICNACVSRKNAFKEAKLLDYTKYCS